MNNFYQGMKKCLIVISGCCVILSILLLIQIKLQKSEMQAVGQLEERIKMTVTVLETENEILSDSVTQMAAATQYFMQEYKRIEQDIKGVAEKYAELETQYAKRMYLDSVMVELNMENGSQFYLERYFEIEEWELQEIMGEKGAFGRLGAEFPNADEWGYLLPVGDKIWVQYEANNSKNSLPTGLVIQNPLIDFGYKDARAGMYLFDIKKMYPDSEVEAAGLEWGNIRYLCYEDKEFLYYYLAINEYGDAVILYITPR